MSKDPNKRHYFKKVKPGEVDAVFQGLAAEYLNITVWIKGKEDKSESFKIKDYCPKQKKLSFTHKGGVLKSIFNSSLLNLKILFKISMGRQHYFGSSHLSKEKHGPEYFILVGQEVFCGQQRSNYRLEASDKVKIQFKIGSIVFDGLDISAGGLSLLASAEHHDLLFENSIFKNCLLRLAKTNYDIPLAKKSSFAKEECSDDDNEYQIKVGFKFVDLPKDVEEKLFKAINSEARGEEIRKKFNFNS